jgi:signal transduction histidine kinase
MSFIQFGPYSLLTKLLIAFLLISLLPVGVLAALNATSTQEALRAETNKALSAAASQTAFALDTFVSTNLSNVRVEAQLPVLARYLHVPPSQWPGSPAEKEALSTLQALNRRDPTFIASYALLDAEGQVALDTDPANTGRNEAGYDYFQKPFTTGLGYASPVLFAPETNDPGLYFSGPVRPGPEEPIVGVLRVRYRAAILQQLIVHTQYTGLLPADSFAMVLDEHHLRLAHSHDPALIFKTIVPLPLPQIVELQAAGRLPNLPPAELSTNWPDFEAGLRNTQTHPFFTTRLAADDPRLYGAATAPLEHHAWLVLFVQPQAPVQAQTQATLLLASVVAGIAVVAAIGFGRLLAAPLAQLNAEVNERKRAEMLLQQHKEHLEEQIAERTTALTQEIGERKRVEETIRHQNEYLAALHETTLGLISRLNSHELLEAIITRAGLLLGAPYGAIYLHAFGAEEMELKVAVGISAQLLGQRMAIGEGVVGQVWQSGQPLVVDDYDLWAGHLATAYNLVGTTAGVPLKSGTRVIGVLNIAYEVGSRQTFGEEELELLSRFAQLASVALDNAWLYTAIQEALAAAELANEAKSEFLANVSHELRTPLTSVLGFTKIIKKRLHEVILPQVTATDPKTLRAIQQVRDNLEIIVTEGERLTALINDVLDLAKIEAGRFELEMVPLDIAEVFERALSATRALFEQKGLEFVADVEDRLPSVVGNRDRLLQVMINLLSNSVKFTDEGAVACLARQIGHEIVVSVIDTGIGIPESEHEQVFEKFKQVGDTLTGKPQGSGLGLPICKEIVERHGGRIWVESQPGHGSAFSFSLPIRNQPPPFSPKLS